MNDRLLYVVYVKGVYRREIIGVYETESLAIDAAKSAAEAEEDAYHTIVCASAPANTAVDDVVIVARFRKSVVNDSSDD